MGFARLFLLKTSYTSSNPTTKNGFGTIMLQVPIEAHESEMGLQ